MAKGAKKTGGPLRRNQRADVPVRVSKRRVMKSRLLIVSSGQETETNYFDGLKREPNVSERFVVVVKKGRGHSPSQTVEQAVNEAERDADFDQVWCVLDVEDQQARPALDQALRIAAAKGVEMGLSNPSFEVWFLSHFEKKAGALQDCDAVIKRLNKHWRKLHGQDYEKNDQRVYERLSCLTDTAIENARWVRETHHGKNASTVDCNSSTDVYKLVEQLTGLRVQDT